MQSERYSFVDGAISGPNPLLETDMEKSKVLFEDLAKIVHHLLIVLKMTAEEIIEILMDAFNITWEDAKRIYDRCDSIIMDPVDTENPFTVPTDDPDPDRDLEP